MIYIFGATMRNYVKRFFEPALKNKQFIFLLALKSIVRNGIELGRIETARRCILAIEHKDLASLQLYVLVGLGVSIVGTIRQFTLKQYGRYSIYVMLKTLYSYVYTKITRVDPQVYEEKGSGKVSSILQEGTLAWSSTIDRLVDEGIMFIISFSIALGYIYKLLGMIYVRIAVVAIALFSIYARSFEKKIKRQRKSRNEVLQEGSRHRQKVIMHKHEVLANNGEEKEAELQSKYYDQAIAFTKKIIFYITLQNIGLDIKNILVYLLYFYLGLRIIQGNGSLSTLTTILLVINNTFNQISTLVSVGQDISDNQFKIQVMNDLLNGSKIIGYDGGSELLKPHGDICCRNIFFQYSKGSQIFHNFTLQIRGKQKTALVGSSGAGKSTLIKLIAGYLHPECGAISIGEQELPNVSNINSGLYASLQSYYKHIGYLTQEPSVFDGTIRENLMYAVSEVEISEKQLKEIIQLAQCNWMYDLKDGLDTEIGEKGVRLSGGQRQRLAIAKIMLKNPSIVLLDEPTSALDSFAEEEVTKAMNNLFQGRTVIIIAHRLQTVKHADDIIVLGNKEGKIGTQMLERGTHEELVEKGGFYAKMLELQSGF